MPGGGAELNRVPLHAESGYVTPLPNGVAVPFPGLKLSNAKLKSRGPATRGPATRGPAARGPVPLSINAKSDEFKIKFLGPRFRGGTQG